MAELSDKGKRLEKILNELPKDILNKILDVAEKKILEEALSAETPENREVRLTKMYNTIMDGFAYDLTGKQLFTFAEILSENGLKDQAEKLYLIHNSVVREDPTEQYDKLRRDMPDWFDRKVRNGAIISKRKQKMLKPASKEVIFDRLFDHVTSYGLDILPEYASPAMRELENEILQIMQSYTEVKDVKDVKSLRKELGQRADIIQLKQFGKDYYTLEKRDSLEAAMPTGGIEFKVTNATPVNGPRFMATRVCGYYGILRFYLEEMARIAPEGANAFLDGTGILRSVTCKGMWSPVVAGTALRPINQPDDEYHIVPVKFFNVEIDKSKKYCSKSKEVAWDKDTKKPYAWQEVVTPRGESTEVSKSEHVLVMSV